MNLDFEDHLKKPLICRGCAGRSLGQDNDRCCCQENKFVNALKNHYVDGTNTKQLREMLELTLGQENFCEEHGYLYEFILTKKNQILTYENYFEDQILYCKKCMQEEQRLGDYTIELLNDEYILFQNTGQQNLDEQQEGNQNWDQKKQTMDQKINEVFNKMREAQNIENKISDKIKEAEARKNALFEKHKDKIQEQSNLLNTDEKKKEKEKHLKSLKEGIELRMKAIAHLGNGYHDYLHDEYLEGESVRQRIIGEDNQVKIGYSIQECFKQFDDIQYI